MASYKRIVLTEHDGSASAYINSDISKELNKFDTTYNSKKLNELYNEFDAMTINSDTVNSTIVKENAVDVARPYAKLKTIVYLTTAIVVTLLLTFLAIYNIFVINGLNKNIHLLQEDIEVAQAQYEAVKNNFGELSDQDLQALINSAFNGEFGNISSNGVSNVGLLETSNATTKGNSTNWFDQFCTFLSNVFGG